MFRCFIVCWSLGRNVRINDEEMYLVFCVFKPSWEKKNRAFILEATAKYGIYAQQVGHEGTEKKHQVSGKRKKINDLQKTTYHCLANRYWMHYCVCSQQIITIICNKNESIWHFVTMRRPVKQLHGRSMGIGKQQKKIFLQEMENRYVYKYIYKYI